jgi:tRNA(Ile)-lysidine synthase
MPSSKPNAPPPLDAAYLRPGMRLAVAVSGGADSVALLRALLEARLGLVLSVAHVHHGIRGSEADADAAFVADLAGRLELPFHLHRVDTPERARQHGESLEEAARHLRYAWFRTLIEAGSPAAAPPAETRLDAVATAHTLDDQAETVLHRFLRGAWTEGLGGIHPVVECPPGSIVRPFLDVRRSEIEAWLTAIGQPWRTDSTNRDPAYTRNRIRAELLPALAAYNPQIATQLANLASIARDEEAWWQAEIARILPSLLLPGKAVRGGGRAASTQPEEDAVAIEVERLKALAPAVRRRVLRAAARQVGVAASFDQTEALLAMCGPAVREAPPTRHPAPKKLQFDAASYAERTPRELRLVRSAASQPEPGPPARSESVPVPGELVSAALGLRLTVSVSQPGPLPPAGLRAWQPGDRARLRHSRAAKKISEILDRLRILGTRRKDWPVLEWQGEIVWMEGAELESSAAAKVGLSVTAERIRG